ncbi:MAG: hypothetical protein ACK528_03910 [Alphaproteobacteria bacterium]|jgi:hypothetical protein
MGQELPRVGVFRVRARSRSAPFALNFAPYVVDHVHRGTHDGAQAGFVCDQCHDAIMGAHPGISARWPIYK